MHADSTPDRLEPEIVLGDTVADQLEDGAELELRGRDADAREPATGSY